MAAHHVLNPRVTNMAEVMTKRIMRRERKASKTADKKLQSVFLHKKIQVRTSCVKAIINETMATNRVNPQ